MYGMPSILPQIPRCAAFFLRRFGHTFNRDSHHRMVTGLAPTLPLGSETRRENLSWPAPPKSPR